MPAPYRDIASVSKRLKEAGKTDTKLVSKLTLLRAKRARKFLATYCTSLCKVKPKLTENIFSLHKNESYDGAFVFEYVWFVFYDDIIIDLLNFHFHYYHICYHIKTASSIMIHNT